MRIQRRPVVDELMLDGELVVLVDDHVLVLSEVASAALEYLVTGVWTSSDTIARHLETVVGLPEDADAAVFSLVGALHDAGLVRIDD